MTGQPGGEVALEGAAELEALLDKLTRKVANQIRSRALRAGAKIILARAKKIAPKKTGLLRRSLKVKAGKRRKGFASFRVQTADGDYRGDTFYGAFLEFGHKIGKRQGGKKSRKSDDTRKAVAPKKFLEPAFEQTKLDALQAILIYTRDGIIRAGNDHS